MGAVVRIVGFVVVSVCTYVGARQILGDIVKMRSDAMKYRASQHTPSKN